MWVFLTVLLLSGCKEKCESTDTSLYDLGGWGRDYDFTLKSIGEPGVKAWHISGENAREGLRQVNAELIVFNRSESEDAIAAIYISADTPDFSTIPIFSADTPPPEEVEGLGTLAAMVNLAYTRSTLNLVDYETLNGPLVNSDGDFAMTLTLVSSPQATLDGTLDLQVLYGYCDWYLDTGYDFEGWPFSVQEINP